jgi:hypothetical protein
MRSRFTEILLVFMLFFAVSCGPATEMPVNGVTIHAGDLEERLIFKDFTYNNCSSVNPLDISVTFGQVLSESFAKELTLGLSGSVEAEIPEVAKAAINVNITDHFSSEKKTILENNQATTFTVPAFSGQKVIVVLRETLRQGEVSYTINGATNTTGFSYRINLENAGLQSESLPCPTPTPYGEIPSPTPLPTLTPTALPTATALTPCGYGFDISVWTPVTTNQNNLPFNNGVCWQLDGFGMSMFGETISVLETHWGPTASWYGVTRRIQPNSEINLEVDVEKLKNGQIWIGFTDSPDNINNGRFLVIKSADKTKTSYLSAFGIVEMYAGQPSSIFSNVFVPFDTGDYKIHLGINENRLSIWLNNGASRAFPTFEVAQPYFFIGYLSNTGVDIDAKIEDIQIQP